MSKMIVSAWIILLASADYYKYFRYKLGSPATPDFNHPISPLSQPASRTIPYYVVGNMTTKGDWSAGELREVGV